MRRDRAKELLRLIENGPHFSDIGLGSRGGRFTPDEAARQYRIWAQSWVLPLLDLVPEIKKGRAVAKEVK